MAPDLNTLPPSPLQSPPASNGASRNQSPSASRTMATSPHSLAATAAMNAGIQNEDQRRTSSGSMRRDVERARRRSSIRMNLNLNDPSVPAPGEMQRSPSARSRGPFPHSPHHERAPSLGELHQELEYEQEGQVVRSQGPAPTHLARTSPLTTAEPPPQHDPPAASPNRHSDHQPTPALQLGRRRQHPHLRALHVSLSLAVPSRARAHIRHLAAAQRRTTAFPLPLQHQPPVLVRRPVPRRQPRGLPSAETLPRRAPRCA
jgi:hypothetical protein